MSFSSLPPELVHQIIKSTVPHTFHSSTYYKRQRTLSSLSLVSKLFRSIAQPLLLEIIELERLGDAEKLPGTRNSGNGGPRTRGFVRCLVVKRDYKELPTRSQEEEGRFLELLRIFETVINLMAVRVARIELDILLSMTSERLTSLQLSTSPSETPKVVRLPCLKSLAFCDSSFDLFLELVRPENVPSLRNFAFDTRHRDCGEYFARSKLDQLLPQLDTLTITNFIWSHPQAAYLHSAASRTLIDFFPIHPEPPYPSTAFPIHVRLRDTSLFSPGFDQGLLRIRLDSWSILIQRNPSLPLKSIYLDSSLGHHATSPFFSVATKSCLKNFSRLCQERKIDLVYEISSLNYAIDPYISAEFVQRQQECRRKEAEGLRRI